MDTEPVADAAEMEMVGGSTSSAVTMGTQTSFDDDDVLGISVSGFVISVVAVVPVVPVVRVVSVVSARSDSRGW